MSESDKPRTIFKLELNFSRIGTHVDVEEPGLIPDKQLDDAWGMMSDFVIDTLDNLGEEPTDERFREIFIEVCYRLIFREMFTLNVMPDWEKADLDRLGTPRRGVRLNKKGSYDDGDWH